MKSNKIIKLMALTIAVITVSSCRREPLYDEGYGLILNFEHTLDVRHEGLIDKPEKMYTIFYDIDTHRATDYALTDPDGGVVNIASGRYDIIAHSFDSPATHIRDDQHLHTIEAYVNEQGPSETKLFHMIIGRVNEVRSRQPDYGDEPLVNSPDHLFVASLRDEEVPVMYEDSPMKTITMQTASIAQPYYIRIGRIVAGVKYVESATVYISGQKRSILIGKGEHTGDPATISFPIERDESRTEFVTTFRTFGPYPGMENHVYLIVNDTFGRRLIWDWDVTDQFADSERLDFRIIIDEDIAIPEPSGGGGGMGFEPIVTDWGNNIENVEI